MSIGEKLHQGHTFIQNEGNGKFLEVLPSDQITLHFGDMSVVITPENLKTILREEAKKNNTNVPFKVI